MLELALLDGSGKRFPIEEGAELLVGVAAHCAVRLNALDVSRTHALVTCQHDRVLVLDLGSTNGTFVNGRRVREAELTAGDAVRFSSVLAQLLPPAREGEVGDAATAGNGVAHGNGLVPNGLNLPNGTATRGAQVGRDPKAPTNDHAQGISEEGLESLLARWGAGGEAAEAALVEWLVASCGMRGAAVLEWVAGEVVVGAADGDVNTVLKDPGCTLLVRGDAKTGPAAEGIDLLLGDRRVVALKAPDLPWLLLVAGRATPDSAVLCMAMRLLAVARRIDGGPPNGKP